LVRAPDGGDDFVWVGGPVEGFGRLVGLRQEAVDCGLQVYDRAEGSAFEAAFG